MVDVVPAGWVGCIVPKFMEGIEGASLCVGTPAGLVLPFGGGGGMAFPFCTGGDGEAPMNRRAWRMAR